MSIKSLFKAIFFVILWSVFNNSFATPIVALDLDSNTAGIQSSITVVQGATLTIDIVAFDDGTGLPQAITSVLLDVMSSTPSVVGLGSTATAGSFVTSLLSPVDAGNPAISVTAGSSLTSLVAPNPGSLGTVGYFDLLNIGALLPTIGATDLIGLTATANTIGSSVLTISPFPIASGVGGLVSAPLSGTITVIASAPEPDTLFLFGIGAFILLSRVGKRNFSNLRNMWNY